MILNGQNRQVTVSAPGVPPSLPRDKQRPCPLRDASRFALCPGQTRCWRCCGLHVRRDERVELQFTSCSSGNDLDCEGIEAAHTRSIPSSSHPQNPDLAKTLHGGDSRNTLTSHANHRTKGHVQRTSRGRILRPSLAHRIATATSLRRRKKHPSWVDLEPEVLSSDARRTIRASAS